MKKVFWVVLVGALGLASSVYAMTPISEAMIQDAQSFGVRSKIVEVEQLLSDWCFVDGRRTNRFGKNERIIVYTPYLVAAVDAQLKAKQDEKVELKDGIAKVNEYNGVLSIGAILDASTKLEAEDLTVSLQQGKQTLKPYSVTLVSANENTVTVPNAYLVNSKANIYLGEKKDPANAEKLMKVKKEMEKAAKKAVAEAKKAAEKAKKELTKLQEKASKGKASVSQVEAARIKAEAEAAKADEVEKAEAAKQAEIDKGEEENRKAELSNTDTGNTTDIRVWNMQYFLYFDLTQVDQKKPCTLNIADANGEVREFLFNLDKVK